MADNALSVTPTPNAATFNPYAPQIAQYQRNQRIADMLRQQAFSDAPSYGGRVSWTQGLAKLLQAYTSNQLQDSADKGLQGINEAQSGMITDAASAAGASPAAIGLYKATGDRTQMDRETQGEYARRIMADMLKSQNQQGAQDTGYSPSVAAAFNMSPEQAAPQTSPQQPQTLPNGVSIPAFAFTAAGMDKLGGLFAPTEQGKNIANLPRNLQLPAQAKANLSDQDQMLFGQNIQPGSPQWVQAHQDQQFKANFVPPISVDGGKPMFDPKTGALIANVPATEPGVNMQFPGGLTKPAVAAPVPGYAGAVSGIAGAKTGAEQGNTVFTNVIGPDGGPITDTGRHLTGVGGGHSGAGGARSAVLPGTAPPPGAPGALPHAPELTGTRGPSAADSVIQKSAADSIAAAPAAVQSSKSARAGLENALTLLEKGNFNTGPGQSAKINAAAMLNNMGVPLMKGDVDGFQTLQKLLQNSLNQAAAGTGSTGSNDRFDAFMHGQPNSDLMNKTALSGAIRYVLSQHDASVTRGNFIQHAYDLAKQANKPNAPLAAQQAWATVYEPKYFDIQRQSPAEQARSVANMSTAEVKKFADWRKSMMPYQ